MGKTTRLTTEEFIKKCYNKFGNKFDYSKIEYKNGKTKVCIICPEHGEFYVRPSDFLRSIYGCSKCADVYNGEKRKKSKEDFILRAREIHGWKYDYSKVEYVNNHTKVCIICPEHGEFWMKPNCHFFKQGCPKCGKMEMSKKRTLTTEEFIKRAREIHGDKYDYSKVKYKGCFSKVCIICPEHGEFWQTPNSHLNGIGCSKCSKKCKLTKEEFILKAREIHGDKYDYSKVEYVNNHTKVCIICPEHGEFWQTPNSHLNGNGCPNCNEYKLEKEIYKILKEKNIKFIQHFNKKWLGRQHLDFYLPDYKIAIECQGKQHFEPIEFFGGEEVFKYITSLDYIKYKLCKNNNVTIFYYSNKDYKNTYQNIYNKSNFFTNKNELINNFYGLE